MKTCYLAIVGLLAVALALALAVSVSRTASAQDCRDAFGRPAPCPERQKKPTKTPTRVPPSRDTPTPVPPTAPVAACETPDAATLRTLCAGLAPIGANPEPPAPTPVPPAPGLFDSAFWPFHAGGGLLLGLGLGLLTPRLLRRWRVPGGMELGGESRFGKFEESDFHKEYKLGTELNKKFAASDDFHKEYKLDAGEHKLGESEWKLSEAEGKFSPELDDNKFLKTQDPSHKEFGAEDQFLK